MSELEIRQAFEAIALLCALVISAGLTSFLIGFIEDRDLNKDR